MSVYSYGAYLPQNADNHTFAARKLNLSRFGYGNVLQQLHFSKRKQLLQELLSHNKSHLPEHIA